VTYSGTYVFDIMDTYGGGVAVLWLAVFETIGVMWVYGVKNFADDVGFMVKSNIGWYWKVSCIQGNHVSF
jgi:solute carrier family 6 amino acid/orphan transporter-like 15/16/17/18/20